MPETGRAISNHTMYVFAKEKYLKTLLQSGKITQAQYGNMERFLFERFRITDVDDFDIPAAPQAQQQMDVRGTGELGQTSAPTVLASFPVSASSESSPDDAEYVSLTEIAREYNPDNPGYVIQTWLQNQNTIEFLKLWEQINNPVFSLAACEDIQNKLRDNTFTLTAKTWIEQTNGKGLQSKSGRYGGTFAHPTIACEFLTNLSSHFKLLLIEMASLRDAFAEEAVKNE